MKTKLKGTNAWFRIKVEDQKKYFQLHLNMVFIIILQ